MATTTTPLSTRARRVLRELLGPDADLDRPEIVAQASRAGLKVIWGCGELTLLEIERWLSAQGTALADVRDTAPPDRYRLH
ncbi:hypothetical protein SAMN05519103_08559 [Rhizobiales bacterium GAS113]|nr:hypothetical protein SAMN05519103_08559 [Rhizobiales bacterium GAS113]